VSCVPPPCGRTFDGGISGFAISHNPSGTIQGRFHWFAPPHAPHNLTYVSLVSISGTPVLHERDADACCEQARVQNAPPQRDPFPGRTSDILIIGPWNPGGDLRKSAIRGPSRRAGGHHEVFTGAPARRAVPAGRDGKPLPCAQSAA
jgi:hypothetical protein